MVQREFVRGIQVHTAGNWGGKIDRQRVEDGARAWLASAFGFIDEFTDIERQESHVPQMTPIATTNGAPPKSMAKWWPAGSCD